jgi:large subunit ribosomal protein L24
MDVRAGLAATATDTPGIGRPEILVLLFGSPDKPQRSLDVAALSSWLGMRAIDRETKRLDAIERTNPLLNPKRPADPPPQPQSAPAAPQQPQPQPQTAPVAPPPRPEPPRAEVPAPAPQPPPAAAPPLPPPVEIRPAPGSVRPPPQRQSGPLIIVPTQR